MKSPEWHGGADSALAGTQSVEQLLRRIAGKPGLVPPAAAASTSTRVTAAASLPPSATASPSPHRGASASRSGSSKAVRFSLRPRKPGPSYSSPDAIHALKPAAGCSSRTSPKPPPVRTSPRVPHPWAQASTAGAGAQAAQPADPPDAQEPAALQSNSERMLRVLQGYPSPLPVSPEPLPAPYPRVRPTSPGAHGMGGSSSGSELRLPHGGGVESQSADGGSHLGGLPTSSAVEDGEADDGLPAVYDQLAVARMHMAMQCASTPPAEHLSGARGSPARTPTRSFGASTAWAASGMGNNSGNVVLYDPGAVPATLSSSTSTLLTGANWGHSPDPDLNRVAAAPLAHRATFPTGSWQAPPASLLPLIVVANPAQQPSPLSVQLFADARSPAAGFRIPHVSSQPPLSTSPRSMDALVGNQHPRQQAALSPPIGATSPALQPAAPFPGELATFETVHMMLASLHICNAAGSPAHRRTQSDSGAGVSVSGGPQSSPAPPGGAPPSADAGRLATASPQRVAFDLPHQTLSTLPLPPLTGSSPNDHHRTSSRGGSPLQPCLSHAITEPMDLAYAFGVLGIDAEGTASMQLSNASDEYIGSSTSRTPPSRAHAAWTRAGLPGNRAPSPSSPPPPTRLLRLRAVAAILAAKRERQAAQLEALRMQLREVVREQRYQAAHAFGLKCGLPAAKLLPLKPEGSASGDASLEALLLRQLDARLRAKLVVAGLRQHAERRQDAEALLAYANAPSLAAAWRAWRSMLEWREDVLQQVERLAAAREKALRARTLILWGAAVARAQELRQRLQALRSIQGSRTLRRCLAVWRQLARLYDSFRSQILARRAARARRLLVAWLLAAQQQAHKRRGNALAERHRREQLLLAALAHWRYLHVSTCMRGVWAAALHARWARRMQAKVLRLWYFYARRCRGFIAKVAAAASGKVQTAVVAAMPVTPALEFRALPALEARLLGGVRRAMQGMVDELVHLQRFLRFGTPPPPGPAAATAAAQGLSRVRRTSRASAALLGLPLPQLPEGAGGGEEADGVEDGGPASPKLLISGQWQAKQEVLLLVAQLRQVQRLTAEHAAQVEEEEREARMAKLQLHAQAGELQQVLQGSQAALAEAQAEQARMQQELMAIEQEAEAVGGCVARQQAAADSAEAQLIEVQGAQAQHEAQPVQLRLAVAQAAERHRLAEAELQRCRAEAEAAQQGHQQRLAGASTAEHQARHKLLASQRRLSEALQLQAQLSAHLRSVQAAAAAAPPYQAQRQALLLAEAQAQVVEAAKVASLAQAEVNGLASTASALATATRTLQSPERHHAAALVSAEQAVATAALELRQLQASLHVAEAQASALASQVDVLRADSAAEARGVPALAALLEPLHVRREALAGELCARREAVAAVQARAAEAQAALQEVARQLEGVELRYRTALLALQPPGAKLPLSLRQLQERLAGYPSALVTAVQAVAQQHNLEAQHDASGAWFVPNLPPAWQDGAQGAPMRPQDALRLAAPDSDAATTSSYQAHTLPAHVPVRPGRTHAHAHTLHSLQHEELRYLAEEHVHAAEARTRSAGRRYDVSPLRGAPGWRADRGSGDRLRPAPQQPQLRAASAGTKRHASPPPYTAHTASSSARTTLAGSPPAGQRATHGAVPLSPGGSRVSAAKRVARSPRRAAVMQAPSGHPPMPYNSRPVAAAGAGAASSPAISLADLSHALPAYPGRPPRAWVAAVSLQPSAGAAVAGASAGTGGGRWRERSAGVGAVPARRRVTSPMELFAHVVNPTTSSDEGSASDDGEGRQGGSKPEQVLGERAAGIDTRKQQQATPSAAAAELAPGEGTALAARHRYAESDQGTLAADDSVAEGIETAAAVQRQATRGGCGGYGGGDGGGGGGDEDTLDAADEEGDEAYEGNSGQQLLRWPLSQQQQQRTSTSPSPWDSRANSGSSTAGPPGLPPAALARQGGSSSFRDYGALNAAVLQQLQQDSIGAGGSVQPAADADAPGAAALTHAGHLNWRAPTAPEEQMMAAGHGLGGPQVGGHGGVPPPTPVLSLAQLSPAGYHPLAAAATATAAMYGSGLAPGRSPGAYVARSLDGMACLFYLRRLCQRTLKALKEEAAVRRLVRLQLQSAVAELRLRWALDDWRGLLAAKEARAAAHARWGTAFRLYARWRLYAHTARRTAYHVALLSDQRLARVLRGCVRWWRLWAVRKLRHRGIQDRLAWRRRQDLLHTWRAWATHKAARRSTKADAAARGEHVLLRRCLGHLRGRVQAKQLLCRVFLLAEQLWDELFTPAAVHGNEYAAMQEAFERLRQYTAYRSAKRATRIKEHTAAAFHTARVLVQAFRAWQAAVVVSQQSVRLRYLQRAALEGWHAHWRARRRDPHSRCSVRARLRRRGYAGELGVYHEALARRALYALAASLLRPQRHYAAMLLRRGFTAMQALLAEQHATAPRARLATLRRCLAVWRAALLRWASNRHHLSMATAYRTRHMQLSAMSAWRRYLHHEHSKRQAAAAAEVQYRRSLATRAIRAIPEWLHWRAAAVAQHRLTQLLARGFIAWRSAVVARRQHEAQLCKTLLAADSALLLPAVGPSASQLGRKASRPLQQLDGNRSSTEAAVGSAALLSKAKARRLAMAVAAASTAAVGCNTAVDGRLQPAGGRGGAREPCRSCSLTGISACCSQEQQHNPTKPDLPALKSHADTNWPGAAGQPADALAAIDPAAHAVASTVHNNVDHGSAADPLEAPSSAHYHVEVVMAPARTAFTDVTWWGPGEASQAMHVQPSAQALDTGDIVVLGELSGGSSPTHHHPGFLVMHAVPDAVRPIETKTPWAAAGPSALLDVLVQPGLDMMAIQGLDAETLKALQLYAQEQLADGWRSMQLLRRALTVLQMHAQMQCKSHAGKANMSSMTSAIKGGTRGMQHRAPTQKENRRRAAVAQHAHSQSPQPVAPLRVI